MATTSLPLTYTWQLITDKAFIGQIKGTGKLSIRNDTVLPVGNLASHIINDGEALAFPRPFLGSWYGKVHSGKIVITYTEV